MLVAALTKLQGTSPHTYLLAMSWTAIALASHIQEGEEWNTSASHLMHTKETEVNSGNNLLQATLNNFPTFSYDFNYPNTCDVI